MRAMKMRRAVGRRARRFAARVDGEVWRPREDDPEDTGTYERVAPVRFDDVDKASALVAALARNCGELTRVDDYGHLAERFDPARRDDWLAAVSASAPQNGLWLDGARGDVTWNVMLGTDFAHVTTRDPGLRRTITATIDRHTVPMTRGDRRRKAVFLPPRSAPNADQQAHERRLTHDAARLGALWGLATGFVGGLLSWGAIKLLGG